VKAGHWAVVLGGSEGIGEVRQPEIRPSELGGEAIAAGFLMGKITEHCNV